MTDDPDAADAAAVPDGVQSDQAKLVYLYLDRVGATSARALATALDLPTLSVFGVLRTLAERGVVEREDDRYRAA